MNPVLFSENSTTFTNNGIGRLSDAFSCVVTEERNGMYELEMEYPLDGQHFSDIGIRSIIAVIPHDGGTMQAFRVYQISKPISGRVIINAQHISYDLSKNTAMPFSVAVSPSACAQALAGLKTNAVNTCPFNFWTDVTTAASYNQTIPASIKSRLGGVEGSVLDQFGGEYEWDNWTVKLHRQRGRINTGIALRYGKNITDFTQEENISETVVGVVPYWRDMDGNVVTLTEKAVYNTTYKDKYSQRLVAPLDLSDKFENQPTEAQLRAAAQVVVNASGFGVPRVSIEVSFVALWQTEEYKDIAPLQRVQLCDEVTVSFERLGVEATAKVVKTEYDVLAERYKSIQIGSIRSNLAMTLNDQAAETVKAIAAQAVSTNTAINNATKWLTSTGGYVIAEKAADGTWEALYFSSSTDLDANNTKLLKINKNGMGFSLTGRGGPYTQAWTIDGHLVADFIFGGTLTLGGRGTKYDGSGTVDNNRGWLKILANDNTTVIGKWDKDGINVGRGSINGASIVLGGSNNGSGTLTINNGNGQNIGTWNNGGIEVKAGTVKLGSKASRDDANAGVYIGSNGIGLGVNSPFKVTDAGALTASNANITGAVKATSGEIGSGDNKFTITGNHIANGKSTLLDSNNGVYVGTDGIALGASSKFKVTDAGVLTATGVDISGTLKTTSGNTSATLQNGVLSLIHPGSDHNAISLYDGDAHNTEVSFGYDDLYWSRQSDHYFKSVPWHDVVELVDMLYARRNEILAVANRWKNNEPWPY